MNLGLSMNQLPIKYFMFASLSFAIFISACSGGSGQSSVFLRKDNFLKTDFYELMTVPAAKDDDGDNLIVKFSQELKDNKLQKAEMKLIVSVNPGAADLRKQNYMIIDGQQFNLNLGKIERRSFSEVYSTERLNVLGRNYTSFGRGGQMHNAMVFGGTRTEVQTSSHDNCVGSVFIDEAFLRAMSKARTVRFRIYLGTIAYEYNYEFNDIAAIKRFANREVDESFEQ